MSFARARSVFAHFVLCPKSVCFFLLLLVGSYACFAGTFLAFGPATYTRGTGDPVTVTSTFSVLNPNTQYTLKAFNGGLQNDTGEYVSETIVALNGVTVISSSNFNQNVAEVDGVTINSVPGCASSGPPGWSCSLGSVNVE